MFGFFEKEKEKRIKFAGDGDAFMKAFFDVTETNCGNEDHYQPANSGSADVHASPREREIARNRSRYEVANNGYMKRIVRTSSNDVVGRVPRLIIREKNEAIKDEIESKFSQWQKDVAMGRKLRTAFYARRQSGEGFLVIADNPLSENPVSLDLKELECDRVRDDANVNETTAKRRFDGVIVDEFDNPIEYRFMRRHPGGDDTFNALFSAEDEFETIPAGQVLHLFEHWRPEQHRGVPEVAPSMETGSRFRRYTLATVENAETAANVAGIIYTDTPATIAGRPSCVPWDVIKIERNEFLTLPDLWQLKQMQAVQPGQDYRNFKVEVISEMGAPIGLPRYKSLGDASDYNFASGKLDELDWNTVKGIERYDLSCQLTAKIFAAWWSMAILVEGYLSREARNLVGPDIYPKYPNHSWGYDESGHQDPQKSAAAQTMRLSNGTTSIIDELDVENKDWRQIQENNALALGLTVEEYRKRLAEKHFGGKSEMTDGGSDTGEPPQKRNKTQRV